MNFNIRVLKAALAGALVSAFLTIPTVVAGQRASVEWPQYGFDTTEQHFSPLKEISATNVSKLGLAWSADLGAYAGQVEGTPLMIDGTLYVTCLLYTSPSPRDRTRSRMPSSA